MSSIKIGTPVKIAAGHFEHGGIDRITAEMLSRAVQCLPLEEQMRAYSYASYIAAGEIRARLEDKSFRCVREMVQQGTFPGGVDFPKPAAKNDSVHLELPLRVNWCGGWTDTPPYCLENGGAVVNVAVKIKGRLPVRVLAEKISEPKIVLEYFDSGDIGEFRETKQLSDFSIEQNPFPLLQAALMVCGLVAFPGREERWNLFECLSGGLHLSTGVVDIPKGSGLGTSSILLAACVKGLLAFQGIDASDAEICRRVLLAEQLMGTGGGWQDQMGGLAGGIKLVRAERGNRQEVRSEQLLAPPMFMEELRKRFCLVYSGRRRLGRTILRQIMSGYIQSDALFVESLRQTRELALEAKKNIEAGNMDGFIANLNRQTQLTKTLDTGFADEDLEKIFRACADMTAGRMICGAGGGGFIQIILREGFSRQQLNDRLKESFPGRGIEVWECDFV